MIIGTREAVFKANDARSAATAKSQRFRAAISSKRAYARSRRPEERFPVFIWSCDISKRITNSCGDTSAPACVVVLVATETPNPVECPAHAETILLRG